jgi:ribonuclease Z
MNRFKIRRSRINHIFISHLHGDHYFGLPGLLNSYSLTSRTEDLHLYAPAPLKAILDLQFEAAAASLSYQLHFHPLDEAGLLLEEKKIIVRCFKVRHRIPCWGFLFREKGKMRKVDPDKARLYEVPSSFFPMLKEGQDYFHANGKRILNEWVTKPPPPAYSYAYCADTIYDESLIDVVRNSSLIYHEATYLDEFRERAAQRFHSTAKQAATLAQKAEVDRLLLGHFSSKYENLDEFRLEAQAVFPHSELAREGTTYLVGK